MKLSKAIIMLTLPLLVSFSMVSKAKEGHFDGIDMEHGKGWHISESFEDDGTWVWTAGGKTGTADTRDEAKREAKRAKREARRGQ